MPRRNHRGRPRTHTHSTPGKAKKRKNKSGRRAIATTRRQGSDS